MTPEQTQRWADIKAEFVRQRDKIVAALVAARPSWKVVFARASLGGWISSLCNGNYIDALWSMC